MVSFLKPGFDPDAYRNAGEHTNDVDEDFEDRDDEEGGDRHGRKG